MYVIRLERSDRFWTEKNEWGSLKDAKTFSEDEPIDKLIQMPVGGVWINCFEPLGEEELPAC